MGQEHEQHDQMFISVDRAFEFVGDHSKYQKRVLQIFSIHWILLCFFIKGLPFLFQSPQFMCSKNGTSYVCDEYIACKEKQFTIYKNPESIISSFELYCLDNSQKVIITIMSIFMGGFIGLFLFSSFSTRKGRKKALVLSSIISGGSLIVASQQTNLYILQGMFFMFGIGHGGYEKIMNQYIAEVSGPKFKTYSKQVFFIVYAVSQLLFNGIDVILFNWRLELLAIAIPLLLTNLLVSRHIFESPVYLVQQKQFGMARYVLNQIALINQRQSFNYSLEEELMSQQMVKKYDTNLYNSSNREQSMLYEQFNSRYIDLFKYSSLRCVTLNLTILWFSIDIVWIGLTYSIQALGFDINQNFLLLAVSELIAALLYNNVVDKKKNMKQQLQIFFGIATICGYVAYLIDIPYLCFNEEINCIEKSVNVSSAMIFKFTFTLSLMILFNYTESVYPTVMEKKGTNYNFFMRKLGCLTMPLIVEYSKQYDIQPLTIFGIISCVCLLVSLVSLPRLERKKDFIEENQQKDIALLEI